MYIHLISKQGMYTVESYNDKVIHLSTKHKNFTVPVSDFKCMAGGHNNYSNHDEVHNFRMIVDIQYVEQQKQTERLLNDLKILQEATNHTTNDTNYVLYDDELDEQEEYDEYMRFMNTKPSYEDLESSLEYTRQIADKANTKLRALAKSIYNTDVDHFAGYQQVKGIKFIIQTDNKGSYRFKCDPYQILDNYHSNIHDIFAYQGYHTDNGGWFKVIGDTVILYYKSGDYGVYKDDIAIQCAQELFPGKTVFSHAGKTWESINDLYSHLVPDTIVKAEDDDDLPF